MSLGMALLGGFGLMAVLVIATIAVMARVVGKSPPVQAMRALRRATTRTIGDGTEGARVKICGKVVALGRSIEAPLTGEQVSAYAVRVNAVTGTDQSRRRRQIFKEFAEEDFEVIDGSGSARVVVKGATFAFNVTHQFGHGTMEGLDVNERLRPYLKSHGLGEPDESSFEQGVLRDDDMVEVCGVATWERVPGRAGADYRSEARRLVLAAQAGQPLYIAPASIDELMLLDIN